MSQFTNKPLGWFKPDANQARQHFDETELRLLGESLQHRQLQPVLARKDGTIVAGHRRYRAAALVGIESLQVVISDEELSESELRICQLTENLHRADLTDVEKWRACEELLRLNPDWSNKDLAKHLKLSDSTVTKYLSPSRCTEAVQDALEAGEVGITSCYEISRAAPEQQQELLSLKKSGASRDRIAQRIRKQSSKDTAQPRMKRVICPLTSGIRISVSGDQLSLDDFIDALGEAQKEARKAREQKLDVKTWQSVMRDKAAASAEEK
ncbi:ParB/RepB/Spo0J family partition protein [Aeoliella sp.]|uniref:ParB/RepB/Spo0J family partition protein n=1 Tax=Aeoliella sp. TaxID=2795800 RepID=UPI003CCBB9D5